MKTKIITTILELLLGSLIGSLILNSILSASEFSVFILNAGMIIFLPIGFVFQSGARWFYGIWPAVVISTLGCLMFAWYVFLFIKSKKIIMLSIPIAMWLILGTFTTLLMYAGI